MRALRASATRAGKAAGALGVIALPLAVWAADGPTEHLNEQVPAQPGYVAPVPGGAFVLPPVAPAGTAPDVGNPFAPVPKRTLERVVFRGNSVVPTSELDAIAAPYLDRPLSENEIDDLRVKLTRRYTDAGFINSGARLVATPGNPEALVFEIVEGHLESVRVTGLAGLSQSYITSRLGDGSAVLNVDVLREHFQLLLSDPLFEQMNARLVPGSAPGQAALDIDVTRAAPYTLTTYYNNFRPPSIGAEGAGLIGSVRNLTGYGDALEINEEVPIEGGSALSSSVHWQIPLFGSATTLLVQLDRGASAVTEEPVNILGIRSTLDSEALGLEQTLYQTLHQNFSIGLLRDWRQNRTTLLGEPFSFIAGEPSGDTVAPVWRLTQDYSFRSEREVFALRSTFSFVHSNLQSISGLPVAFEPDRDYSLWLLQGQYARQVGDNDAQLVLRATLQATQSHVLPLDSMVIGGDTTLRGFRENQLLVDDGQIINIEYSTPIYRDPAHALGVALVPFYDVGRGANKGAAAQTLSDAGVQGQIHWHALEFDLSKAWRLSYPQALVSGRGNLQDRGVYFQLRYTVALQ